MPSTVRGYPYPSGTDNADVPGDIQALADAVNGDVNTHEGTKTGVHGIPAMTSGHGLIWNGTTWVSTDLATQAELNALTKTFRTFHTFAVAGEVRVSSGAADVIPAMFVSKASGQTVKLIKARTGLAHGTSLEWTLLRNGAGQSGWQTILTNTTESDHDGSDITLADNDKLQILVTAVSGAPQNLSITLVLEHTV